MVVPLVVLCLAHGDYRTVRVLWYNTGPQYSSSTGQDSKLIVNQDASSTVLQYLSMLGRGGFTQLPSRLIGLCYAAVHKCRNKTKVAFISERKTRKP